MQDVQLTHVNPIPHGLRYIHLTLFVLYVSIFEDLITFSLNAINIYTPITDYISQVGFIAVALLIVLDLLNQKRTLLPTLLIFVGISLLFYMNYREFTFFQPFIQTSYITFITNGLIIFYLATNIKNYDRFFDYMKPFILFSLIYGIIVFAASRILGKALDMNIAYAILPSALASLVLAYRTKKIKYYIYLSLFSILLFILGNRGTILILIVFFVAYSLSFRGKFDIKSLVTPLVLLGLLLLMTFVVVDNLNLLNDLRLFAILSDKSFFQDNIRMKLWTDGIRFAIDNPLSIQGAVYDRMLYFMKYAYTHDIGFYIDETMVSGLYAHNLFVELLINFGFLIGGVLAIFLIYNLLKVMWIKRTQIEFILYVVSIGFIQLMYSNSYLTSMWFWFMLGSMYSILRYEKMSQKTDSHHITSDVIFTSSTERTRIE